VRLENQIYLTTVQLAGLVQFDKRRVDESSEFLVCVLARAGFARILGRVSTLNLFVVALRHGG
jgi:hypothetical protein